MCEERLIIDWKMSENMNIGKRPGVIYERE